MAADTDLEYISDAEAFNSAIYCRMQNGGLPFIGMLSGRLTRFSPIVCASTVACAITTGRQDGQRTTSQVANSDIYNVAGEDYMQLSN